MEEGQHRSDILETKLVRSRLRWFGQVQRRDGRYIGRGMLKLELPGIKIEECVRGDSWMW